MTRASPPDCPVGSWKRVWAGSPEWDVGAWMRVWAGSPEWDVGAWMRVWAGPLEWHVDRGCLKKMLVSRWLSGCVCIRIPMVLLSDVVYYSLLIDAIDAFCNCIWMIIWSLCFHKYDAYKPYYWTMWALQEDRENTAVQLLFASLEFILGTVRAFAVAYWNSAGMLWLVAATYAVIGVFFLGLLMYRRLTGWLWKSVSLVALICGVLGALVAMEK